MALDESALRARRAYDSAADHFDDPALGFWSRHGERTVERLALAPGGAVLDAPCGSGASALPAAHVVGPGGSVVGADLSSALLELARAKADSAGLGNIAFRVADMRELGYPDEAFDAVVCVFGIFFVDDMPALAREFWRMLRPGGVLAVTTWGPDAFEPGATALWDAVGEVRPDLVRSFNPWDTLTTTEKLLDVFRRAGIAGATAEAEAGRQAVAGPGDWWSIILGTGYRATVDALQPSERARVEERVRAAMADGPPMNSPAVFASARKPH
jgi:ubiquinone/menaquinone biosynthesis C-methylase UbiE